jgi:UDP:flavonoid glycosyltransferase YjiC (YdhE family)
VRERGEIVLHQIHPSPIGTIALVSRVVLTTWGSHGDIDPFIGLGIALKGRGHDVTVATLEFYRPAVSEAGLLFHAIRPRVDPTDTSLVARIMDRNRGSEFLLTQVLFPAIDDTFEDIDAAASGADLLVSHPITFATPIVAQYRRIPWASVALAPTSMFSAYDFPAFPPAPWLKGLQRLGRWPGALLIHLLRRATDSWTAPARALRARLGLPPGANPIIEGQHSPWLVLALYSRVLGNPQPDWPPHVVVTGPIFYDAPHGARLSPELETFLADGPPPLVFTLGTSAVLLPSPFWHESAAAARRIGARAVLLAGPDHAQVLNTGGPARAEAARRDGIVAVDRAPHSLLFPRASIIIQQCGIGTMAQVLRSGRPMLAVPFAHDQPDNALRAAKLGVARVISPSRYRAGRVSAALNDLLQTPRYGAAAAEIATIVRSKSGALTACEALEQTFRLGKH